MRALRAAIGEIVGLFVDDAGLALFATLAIALVTVVTKLGVIAPLWGALGLVLGCAAALAATLIRAGRRNRG
jgi:hypothetical protein